MMNAMITSREVVAVGDQVWVIDPRFAQSNGMILAEVVEIRYVLGERKYLVETRMGERKLVGANQINRVEVSSM